MLFWPTMPAPLQGDVLLIWLPEVALLRELVHCQRVLQAAHHARHQLHLLEDAPHQP